MSNIAQIDVQTLKQALDSNTYTLLDVRTLAENQDQPLPFHCIHIPLDELRYRLDEINKSKPIAIMCAGGLRSMQAAMCMQRAGFNVVSVEGGMKAWQANFSDK